MHYVKQFNINGVETKQVACIELHGKPNAATEGYVGVLGIDVDSPLKEVYKCVAVNGSIYTWDLLSSGLSVISANTSGSGIESVQFPYNNLRIPNGYVIKVGDLIFDREGYLYQIDSLDSTYCIATYSGTRLGTYTDYNIVYPIGSIYMSTINASPASFIGGSWERLKDKFLLGAGDTYSAGSAGGAATHALTVSELPRHSHAQQISVPGENGMYKMVYGTSGSGTAWGQTLSEGTVKSLTGKQVSTDYTGSNTAHNNMPPYLTVYMWKRVA